MIKGKTKTIFNDSYNPFIHRCSLPPILGIANTINTNKLHHQNACCTCANLPMRNNNSPAKKGYITLVKPIRSCNGSSDQPPIKSPELLVTAYWIRAQPAINTNMESIVLENLLTNSA